MENAEEVMQILERFTRLKQKEIPKELDDYLQYVAKTGDTVFKWPNLKYLFREKLLNVITHFHDTTPRMDEIPRYPNVDPFNYESMKSSLLERLELFNAAPFTIQRLCELLIDPRKQYNRIDKFMRALEKNILVSTVEPGRKRTESENGDSLDSVVNGDLSLDVNVDIDMENESLFSMETQNGNGTAEADGSPVGTVDSANEPESAGDAKPEEETDVVNVTSTHEAPTIDEDLQPSPKKVKLDVDAESEVTAEPSTEVDNKKTEEVEKSDEPATEKVDTLKEAEEKVTEIENDIKVKEKGEEDKTENVSPAKEIKAENEAPIKETSDIVKPVDESDIKTNESKEEVIEKPANKNNDAEAAEEVKENDVVDVAVAEKENGKPEETVIVAEQIDNKETEEKIVEKQEIEKCEKDLTSKAVEAETETSKEKESETPTQVEEVKSNDKVEPEKEKEEVATTDQSDEVQSSTTETEVVTPAVDASKEEPTVVDTTTAVKEITEPEKSTETEKLITSSTAAEEKTEEPVETAPPASNAEIESAVATAEASVDTATTAITSTSNTEVPEVAKSVTPIDEDLPAAKTDSVEISAAKSISKVAVVVPTPPPTLPLPTLALNDQPMEEDITNVVDEVVMAESTTSSAGVADGIEMATDAMEATVTSDAAKIDDPTDGMDVDDTSQPEEAMDQ